MSASLENGDIAAARPCPAGSMAQAVLEMLSRAERAIETDPRQARIFIGEASRLLEPPFEVARAPASAPGLAPWQERKVLRHIANHLDHTIRNQDLAEIVGLSIGYFSRRFKSSFGVCPRDYVIRSRLERAKTLMRQSRSSLCQIALDSGFADQSHMSRTFHALVGRTPSCWRREQASDIAA